MYQQQQFINNLGNDFQGWSPAFADYKQILEQLKSQDEMMVYDAVLNLQNQLSVAQENTLNNFMIDQYIPALIDIIKRPSIMDLSNEIKLYAVKCLSNLMDIFPTICNSVVSHGAVKVLNEAIENGLGFIDLSEACIKAFEQISLENPYAILTSGALGLCLNIMDFFESTIQKRILQLLLSSSRTAASESDFDNYVSPTLPVLCMLVNMRNENSQGTQEKLEIISSIMLRISESFLRYYSPNSQFDKVQSQFKKLQSSGIIESVIQALEEFSYLDQAMKITTSSSPEKGGQKNMSNLTIQNFLKLLSLCCRFSLDITKQLMKEDVFKIINGFLPSQDDLKKQHYSADQFPFIIDSINLLDNLFPEKDESVQLVGEQDKLKTKFEKEKREYIESNEQQKIAYVAEKVLPKIFFVYENNMTQNIRIKTLQIIDKIIQLFNNELLNNFIEPYSFAKFIFSNFKSHSVSSISICLEMVNKLMTNNAKSYTLPLLREGITEFIQKISTEEGFEKTLGIKIGQIQKEKDAQLEEVEAMIAAKTNFIRQQQELTNDQEQKQQYENSLQRYLEAVRQHHLSASGQVLKPQVESHKQIIALAASLCSQYFNNETFMTMIKEQCAEEFQLLNEMKNLAQKLKEEAAKVEYDENSFKELMKQLVMCLANKKHVMCYEFSQSGLLQALEYLLTYTPRQVQKLIQQEGASSKGEEMKESEMKINTSSVGKRITKKEARTFLLRLRLFAHFILKSANGKPVMIELISLCNELLSLSETEIFDLTKDSYQGGGVNSYYGGGGGNQSSSLFGSGGVADLNASVNALKQLSKRLRINLVYDPELKNVKTKEQIKPQSYFQKEMSQQQQQNIAVISKQSLIEGESSNQLQQHQPTHQLMKSQSEHPAFSQIGGDIGFLPELKQSKVFLKRDQLYCELKSVLLSVEQCASLWLFEDFLRNKVKSMNDVKQLKTPTSFYDQLQKQQRSSTAKNVMDKTMQKLKEILTVGSGIDSEEYALIIADEILNSKELSDDEQLDIIRQMELQSLQMMENLYSGEDSPMGDEGNESFENRLQERESIRQRMSEEELDAEQRIYDFHRTIEKIKQLFKDKQVMKKKEQEQQQQKQKLTSNIFDIQSQSLPTLNKQQDLEKQKNAFLESLRQKQVDQIMKQGDQLDQQQKEELKIEQEIKKQIVEQFEEKLGGGGEDIEMTDEEEEEKRQKKEELEKIAKYMRQAQSSQKEYELQPEEYSIQKADTIGQDLEELIKANGDDIEYEFYYNGNQLSLNQTVFEILRMQTQQHQQQQQVQSQKYKSYYGFGEGSRNQQQHSDYPIIYFTIKMKEDFTSNLGSMRGRNDSQIGEGGKFEQKRKRTMSEAVEDISMSAVNSLVQQLVDKEFQVFSSKELQTKSNEANFKYLEQSLKLLKVLNFLCKHISIISNQGMRFLINNLPNDVIQNDQGFTDYDLQVALSQIHPNMFHHHKLDLYIIKNIQDPYNIIGGGITETLQQIFRNCSFLFPFSTRQLFFKLISFIGSIDMNRSIYFLRQFLKSKGGKLAEDKALKISKQKVIVDRSRILDCAFNLLNQIRKRDFLEVQYKDEQGIGQGPTLEFYYIVSDEIKNKKKEIWRKSMPDNDLFPAPIAVQGTGSLSNEELKQVYEMFRLAGTIIAKSITDDKLIDLPMSSLFWDLVLGKKMNLFDLERIDKDLFKVFAELQQLANQKRLIDKQQNARVEDLSLYFVLPGYDNIELKHDGKNIEVNINNLQEYIDLVMSFMFHETIKIQLSAFKKGFNSIFSIDSLRSFSTVGELEEMICGTEKNDEQWSNMQLLSECITPAHGYHTKSVEYLNFLRFMSELSREERRKFLKFVTGSPRLPNGGFEALEPKLTLVLKKPLNSYENPDHILPSVMTCQNYVKLPSYSSYEVLKDKFQTAYNEGCNNFTLS